MTKGMAPCVDFDIEEQTKERDTVQFNLARSEFVTAQRPGHRVAIICGVLSVSSSDYYAWRKRPHSARAQMHVELGAVIVAIHRESRRT